MSEAVKTETGDRHVTWSHQFVTAFAEEAASFHLYFYCLFSLLNHIVEIQYLCKCVPTQKSYMCCVVPVSKIQRLSVKIIKQVTDSMIKQEAEESRTG